MPTTGLITDGKAGAFRFGFGMEASLRQPSCIGDAMNQDIDLLYDGDIATAISGAANLLNFSPDNALARDKLVLAQNLQVARKAIEGAVKSSRVAKDGRVWISRNALEGLKRALPED